MKEIVSENSNPRSAGKGNQLKQKSSVLIVNCEMHKGDHDTADNGDELTKAAADKKKEGAQNIESQNSQERVVDRSRSSSPGCGEGMLASAETLADVVCKATTMWNGVLHFKNGLFPTNLHLTDGDSEIIDGLMQNEDGKNQMRMTQKMRLEQPKLDDVLKRMATCKSYGVFLGVAGPTTKIPHDDPRVQTRPIRNMVSYLKQIEAAGVSFLLNKETEAAGVFYSFPPCKFSSELLKKTCPNLTEESLKENHLVILVLQHGSA